MLNHVADVCYKYGYSDLSLRYIPVLAACLFILAHVVLVCSAIIGRSTKDFKTCLLSFVKFMPLVSVVAFLKLVCKIDLKVLYYKKYTQIHSSIVDSLFLDIQ